MLSLIIMQSRIYHNPLIVFFESHWLGGVLALALVVVVRRVGPRVPSERNKQTVRGTPLNLFI